jgi:phage terminase large subunit GpA-like protein
MTPEPTPESLAAAEAMYAAAAAKGLEPDPQLTVAEWADEFRNLTLRSSAEPGPWRTSRTPYLRQVMDDLSPSSPWETIVLMAAAQVGKSEGGNNWLGYSMHISPGPMMVVYPTVDLARRTSKQRIGPLIEECSPLQGLVMDARAIRATAGSQNTVQVKSFTNGGLLVMVGANSPTGLRSTPCRYLYMDEVDGYPASAGKEGDPCELAIARTTNFARRKIFITSTPTISGRSRIERFFEESDQCHCYVPCPNCGQMQTLRMEQLRWPKGEPFLAVYICERCEFGINDSVKKGHMLPRCEWRPTAKGDGKTRGYYLPGLISPWLTFAQIAEKSEKAGSDPTKLQVFQNTVLGLPFLDSTEVPDPDRLYERREGYPIGTVAYGGLLLTAGVDVQMRRLEVEIVAWGRNRESWSVDYRMFEGDTSQPAVWRNIEALLDEEFPSAYGQPIKIRRLAVDSGFNTMAVYDWVHRMGNQRVMAIKGDARHPALVGLPRMIEVTPYGRHIRYGIRLWPLNSSIAKEELYRWLRSPMPDLEKGAAFPTGYCHFPSYGKPYFDQLCAEVLVTKLVNGVRKSVWEKKQDRNEALDCRIYARAAAASLRFETWKDSRWDEMEHELTVLETEPTPAPARRVQPSAPVPKFTAFRAKESLE